MQRRIVRAVALCLALVMFGACSKGPTPAQQAAARKAAMETKARPTLQGWQQMIKAGNYQLALPLGEEILAKYPDTQAAVKVKSQIADVRAKAKARANTLRLQRLWAYQVAPIGGGTQSTAAIDATRPAGLDMRLVLRRHTQWGLSVFLYADGSRGFDCRGTCTVPAMFDDHKVALKAYVPAGGRPALMFRDEKGFIARMQKTAVLHLKVHMKGTGLRDLEFEVGGFDAGKWKPLKK
jgi:hypothetical protein